VQGVGVSKLGGKGRARHITRQGGQGAGLHRGGRVFLGKIGSQHGQEVRAGGPQAGQQPVAGSDRLGEQVFLGVEVGVEGAARQTGRQHDVVDVGAGIAAQPEQAGGVAEDFSPSAGGAGGALRHIMMINISYVDHHIKCLRRWIARRWSRRRARRD